MTDVTTIEDAWETYVWSHATMAAITLKVFKYEIATLSEKEVQNLLYMQEVNCFEVVTTREVGSQEIGNATSAHITYPVQVRYTRQADPDGDNYRAVLAAIASLQGVVNTSLGSSWQNTVDYYLHQEGPLEVQSEVIANVPCYRGVYRFFGHKFTTI